MMKFPKKVLVDIELHLKEEKKRVIIQIVELAKQDPFADTDRLSDNAASDTEAKEEFNHDRYQAMLDELKMKDEAVTQALMRIDRGTYGFCTNCGQLIDTERLAAIPTATLCMTCEATKRKRY
jgi:RNA polymerase-binding transcription factor DksA